MQKMRIIDAHSHIGECCGWQIEGKIEDYVRHVKEKGITESILMPPPTPIINGKRGKIVPVEIDWDEDSWWWCKLVDCDIEYENGLDCMVKCQKEEPADVNPYQSINLQLYQKIAEYGESDVKLHFVPLIHPCLDTTEYIEMIIKTYNPVALKIHGIGAVIFPELISNDFCEVVRKYDIPLIIHTDIDRNQEDSPSKEIRNLNTPLSWLKFLEANNIRAYLAHGAKLCKESCEIINKSENFVVGLGPDRWLSYHPNFLAVDKPYLPTLFSAIDTSKICFDLDYPYNVQDEFSMVQDWDSLGRLLALGLTEEDYEKVFCDNARKFFKL